MMTEAKGLVVICVMFAAILSSFFGWASGVLFFLAMSALSFDADYITIVVLVFAVGAIFTTGDRRDD